MACEPRLRTGGLTPDAIPSCESVAKFIVACRAARIPFKFTAGMHAALRSVRALTYAERQPKTMMHGFINAFFAAGAAWQDADLHTVTEILAETATEVFDFDDERALCAMCASVANSWKRRAAASQSR